MSLLLFGFMIFTLSLLVIELSLYSYRNIKYPDRHEVRRRLLQSMAEESTPIEESILKKEVLSDVPFINRLLTLLPGIDRVKLILNQSNVKFTLGFFILLSMTCGLIGYLFTSVLLKNALLSLPCAIIAGSLPLLYIKSKKKKRMQKFEKQFPEALDLIARALRAGHAFSSGMKLAAEEFDDPLGTYFEETLDEINFGVSVADALTNLAHRVDCPDVKFFVVSVILQRQTGGNLSEILEGVASLMRARFKFRRKVQALSAEGLLTGKILVIIPILLFIVLYLLNPSYAGTLIFDPAGKFAVGITVCLIFLGYLAIKRIVRLDV